MAARRSRSGQRFQNTQLKQLERSGAGGTRNKAAEPKPAPGSPVVSGPGLTAKGKVKKGLGIDTGVFKKKR